MNNESFRDKLDTMYRDLRSWARTHYSPKEFAEDITNDVIVSLLDLYEREGLEWEKKITNPVIIDKQKTILRLDLRDYGWQKQIWKKMLLNR